MNLQEIRAQYPEYNSLSDGELAYRLWDKSYKDTLPMGLFADKINLDNPSFKEMTDVAKQQGYSPTHYSAEAGYVPPLSRVRAFFQGQTFGFGDEILGATHAIEEKLKGSDKPFGQLMGEVTHPEREMLKQYQKEKPVESTIAQIGGAVASPANLIPAPAAIQALSPVARAAVTSGAQGAVMGAGSTEGDVSQRALGALEVGIPSALFGAGAQKVFDLGAAGTSKLVNLFNKSAEAPSLETLKAAKTAAYDAVEKSGLNFGKDEMQNLFIAADDTAKRLNYIPEVDLQTKAALKILENNSDKSVSVGELDKIRQGLWNRYQSSGGSEPAIRGMIDHIDEMLANYSSTNDLMSAARMANSRYKKAELLNEAFEKAQRQTSATGSGGNIFNKYRQAVVSILNNPKEARWFNETEIESMNNFIKGTAGQNVLRKIGKLSPSGNGLMMALEMMGTAINPALIGMPIAGGAAKAISDSSAASGAEALISQMATGQAPIKRVAPYLPGLPSASGATVQTLENK